MAFYLSNLIALLAIFIILGMSFNLLMGNAGLFSIAHGAFFGLGAYTTGLLMRDAGWGFLPALLAACALCALISMMLGIAARRVTDVYLVILTLAFQVGAIEIIRNSELTGGAGGLIGIPRPDLLGAVLITPEEVATLAVVFCLLVAALLRGVVRSPFGRSLKALREDELAARSLGKATPAAKIKAFALSSALAGMAGALFAVQVRYISTADFGLDRSIEVLSLTIIGGLAVWWGPFVGAAVVLLIPEALTYLDLPDTLVGAVKGFAFSLLLLAFLLFRPQGIAGRRRREAASTPAASVVSRQREEESILLPEAASPVDGRSGGDALRCEGVSISFGGLTAVDDVTLTLRPGSITGLVGPNGAGKTTLFNLLSGLLDPNTGRVYFGERDITRSPLDARARGGIVRSFQEMRLFGGMTARENLLLALTPKSDERLLTPGVVLGGKHGPERERLARADEMLEYLGIAHHADTNAGDMSYAEQKLLMMGRLLATKADCYLLDEPMSGLDAAGRERILALLRDTVAQGATICLVEHSLDVIRSVCSWVVFLADGKLVREGPTAEITGDRELAAMYFGT
ncbi:MULTISPECIES: ATP-binding cassette domain-containing protein [unclassified Micromonospora]|uniref:branched-chain amino acid ABC transporter ATP-binding protein/permease n=1 Tax=unclassified Micromonospora TaxID=2617518 RepID=UPI0033B591AD